MSRVANEVRERKAKRNVDALVRAGYNVSRPDPNGNAYLGKIKLPRLLLEEMSPEQLFNIVRFLTCRARRFA